MKLIIEDDEGRKTVVPVVRDEITIGRNDDCLVRLTEKNVSRKHGRLLRESGQFFIEDLNSFTGIRVNGEKIAGKHAVNEGDLIQISEYDLSLQAAPGEKPHEDTPDADDEVTDVGPRPTSPEERALPATGGARMRGALEDAEARKMAVTATIRLSDLKQEAEAAPQQVPAAERPKLVGISGTYRGKELVLDRTPIRLGRSGENDVEIDHPSISRKQCRLHLEEGSWKVMDAESRNGVRVNGEPYATIGLRHGDVLEIGHLRFAFVAAGQPFKLPAELTPVPGTGAMVQPPSSSKGLIVGLGVGVAIAAAAAFFVVQHKAESREVEQGLALRNVDEAVSAHRYGEALRALENARRAGVKPQALAAYASVADEARSEDLYEEMQSAATSQDWERARKLLPVLTSSKTYFGGKAAEKSDAITAGYVNLHVAAAALMKDKDNAGCMSEAQLALTANPQSGDARSLVDSCKLPPQAAAAPAPAAAPAVHTASVAAARPNKDVEARQLIVDGNAQLASQDVDGAIALYQRAMGLKPSNSVLAGAYRSMGIASMRAGNVEQGAHYYRLYLPLCTNPTEKAQLQKTLAEYDARQK
jgi:ABC transport system ATP-binding/permease protein